MSFGMIKLNGNITKKQNYIIKIKIARERSYK